MQTSLSRDAADRPEASHWPDPAAGMEFFERVLKWLTLQSLQLPPQIGRKWFLNTAAELIVAFYQEAAGELAGGADTELVGRLLSELVDSDNPRLHAKCLVFAFGLPLLEGMSETDIADEEGVDKATVSKRCVGIKERFGLKPSRGMKSDRAVESYRRRQRGKRAKPIPQPWAFQGFLTNAYAAARA